MSNTEQPTHEPLLTVGRKWTTLPACSCGWLGEPTYDRGEATRKAYAHVARMQREQAKVQRVD